MNRISSPRNRRVAYAAALHRRKERRARGQTLIEGPNLLSAAIDSRVSIEMVYATDGDRRTQTLCHGEGISLTSVSEQVISRISQTVNPQGPVAVIKIPEAPALRSMNTLVLVRVTDPGNMGTLIRTAAAFGFAIAVTPNATDPWSPKVLRAAAGANFAVRISLVQEDPIPELIEVGLRVVATRSHGGSWPSERLNMHRAILIGNETYGLPVQFVAAAHETITIPISGNTESLNAAVAGAIIMYEMATSGIGT